MKLTSPQSINTRCFDVFSVKCSHTLDDLGRTDFSASAMCFRTTLLNNVSPMAFPLELRAQLNFLFFYTQTSPQHIEWRNNRATQQIDNDIRCQRF